MGDWMWVGFMAIFVVFFLLLILATIDWGEEKRREPWE